MIAIKAEGPYNVKDLIARSPVAALPDAEEVLRQCMFRSIEVKCGYVDEKLACVWGLIPPTVLSNTAYLWLLTTDIVAEHKFLFVRHSQRYIEQALTRFPTIVGDVRDAYANKRWLRWLGAEFGPEIGGRIPFVIRKK